MMTRTMADLHALGWTLLCNKWPQQWTRANPDSIGFRFENGAFFDLSQHADLACLIRAGCMAFQGEIDYSASPIPQRSPSVPLETEP